MCQTVGVNQITATITILSSRLSIVKEKTGIFSKSFERGIYDFVYSALLDNGKELKIIYCNFRFAFQVIMFPPKRTMILFKEIHL